VWNVLILELNRHERVATYGIIGWIGVERAFDKIHVTPRTIEFSGFTNVVGRCTYFHRQLKLVYVWIRDAQNLYCAGRGNECDEFLHDCFVGDAGELKFRISDDGSSKTQAVDGLWRSPAIEWKSNRFGRKVTAKCTCGRCRRTGVEPAPNPGSGVPPVRSSNRVRNS